MRKNNRKQDEPRKISIVPNFQKNSIGSVLINFEDTKVICSTNISRNVPRWLLNENKGWITAEYSMLPNSSGDRVNRDRGNRMSGRTQEIQRLIGRSLRQAIDLSLIPGVLITIDCDVLNADGGTRTASISGAFIATYLALKNYYNSSPKKFFKNQIAAISVGKVNNDFLLDLDYSEDSIADFDMNIVLNENLDIVEIQGTSEDNLVSRTEMNTLLELGTNGIKIILKEQSKIIDQIDNT
ncbi:MAG: ribonuclease PH [Dehalococcoidales bacterium]|jgi:ribonuclease PH|nr:ribonuclease PH [Dehalococcoidia bacterium]NCG34485.1 ribonuclease PH [Dehalococcoidales bacterium]